MPSSNDLTTVQLAELVKTIEDQLHFVAKMKLRMQALQWPAEDPVLVDTQIAQDALARLRMNLHYRYCDAKRNDADK